MGLKADGREFMHPMFHSSHPCSIPGGKLRNGTWGVIFAVKPAVVFNMVLVLTRIMRWSMSPKFRIMMTATGDSWEYPQM